MPYKTDMNHHFFQRTDTNNKKDRWNISTIPCKIANFQNDLSFQENSENFQEKKSV